MRESKGWSDCSIERRKCQKQQGTDGKTAMRKDGQVCKLSWQAEELSWSEARAHADLGRTVANLRVIARLCVS